MRKYLVMLIGVCLASFVTVGCSMIDDGDKKMAVMPDLTISDYTVAEEELQASGFFNIETKPMSEGGSWEGILGHDGTIVSAKIRGKNVVAGKEYPEDSKILTALHG